MATKSELEKAINEFIKIDASLADQIVSAASEIVEEAKRNKAAVQYRRSGLPAIFLLEYRRTARAT